MAVVSKLVQVVDNGSMSRPFQVCRWVFTPPPSRYDCRKGTEMAAMKPRTGDGPLEVTKEGRGIIMRVPLEGGGRLVVEMTPDEARALGEQLTATAG